MNSVFDILSWSFWCSKRYLRWPEWNFSTSLAARMVFSLGQWKMIRGSCWLSFAAHPIRIYPRVPYWLFFKIYAFPPKCFEGNLEECMARVLVQRSAWSLAFIHQLMGKSGSECECALDEILETLLRSWHAAWWSRFLLGQLSWGWALEKQISKAVPMLPRFPSFQWIRNSRRVRSLRNSLSSTIVH